MSLFIVLHIPQNKYVVIVDHIDCPNQIKNKKSATHSINKNNNKSFEYAATVTINHEETKNIHKEYQKFSIL